MPTYHFQCPKCGATERHIMTPKKAREPLLCKREGCDAELARVPKPPSTQVTETLDNGLMPRKLERPADAEQIYHERAYGKKGVI